MYSITLYHSHMDISLYQQSQHRMEQLKYTRNNIITSDITTFSSTEVGGLADFDETTK